jgi:protein MBA1
MCTSGVAEGFRNRIAARPPGVTAEWTLKDKYKVSLISNHPVMISLPGYEDTGVQQIVFRIQTTQNLTYRSTSKGSKYEGLGFDSPGAPVTDYFVLQRRVVRGKFQDWKVWGFANEWDLETIKEDAQHRRELEAYEGSSDM